MAIPRRALTSSFVPSLFNSLCLAQSQWRIRAPSALGASVTHSSRQIQRLLPPHNRTFTSTSNLYNWQNVKRKLRFKDPRGRPRVATGGSTRGSTVIWGDYGLRMKDHGRRISQAQLRNGEEVIRRRMRGLSYKLYLRVSCGVAVFTKGNESRMGTGKGKFDYWCARVPVSRVVFEISGDCHEQVIRDALRLGANKLPGLYDFVKKGDPPVMGITKMTPGITAADLMRPRIASSVEKPSLDQTAKRLSSASTGAP